MNVVFSLIPLLLFVTIFFGSGVIFSILGSENAFDKVSPALAIIPSILLALLMSKVNGKKKITLFLKGLSNENVIGMCAIFLLAGALSSVTKGIGSADSAVNFALSVIPSDLLLIGIFITSALISTAIGTSMGTISALGAIICELSSQGAFSLPIGAATLIGGATFGDNLSIISDTTIASVSSQSANLKDKLKLNSCIALIAAIVTIVILFFISSPEVSLESKSYSYLLLFPYVFMIILAVLGINVFVVLISSIIVACLIGIISHNGSLILCLQDVLRGFYEMSGIVILSMLIGGLSGLLNKEICLLADKLVSLLPKNSGRRGAEFLIAAIVSLFDILLANNVIAIIFSGDLVKDISKKHGVKPHVSAVLLDIFSCIFQGIIPYGAQVLLICAIAKISPFEVIGQVYYCYVLGIISLLYICFRCPKSNKTLDFIK